MREVRQVVLRLDLLRGTGHGGRHVAFVADDLARLAGGRFELRAIRGRVVARVRAVVPDDLERLSTLHRRPRILRDDGDSSQRIELRCPRCRIDRDHADHTGHLLRLGVIEAHHLSAVDLRTRDDGEEHALRPRVHRVLRAARDDGSGVDELELAGADIAKLRRVLEADLVRGRHRQARRRLRERAIPEASPRRPVDHLAVLRLHLADRHLPLRRRGRLEHLPRGRAAAAHRHEEVARAARAVGVLVAVFHFVAVRLRDADAAPVGLELVGDDHRHSRADTLPHLRAVADDGDDAVLGDRDEHEGIVHPPVRHPVRAVLRRIFRPQDCRVADREHQSAERGRLREEAPPADILDEQAFVGGGSARRRRNHVERRVHAAAPFAPAACLIAARIRPYVPQRQMLPAIAASMSASVGLGLLLSSAVADMICPAWQ